MTKRRPSNNGQSRAAKSTSCPGTVSSLGRQEQKNVPDPPDRYGMMLGMESGATLIILGGRCWTVCRGREGHVIINATGSAREIVRSNLLVGRKKMAGVFIFGLSERCQTPRNFGSGVCGGGGAAEGEAGKAAGCAFRQSFEHTKSKKNGRKERLAGVEMPFCTQWAARRTNRSAVEKAKTTSYSSSPACLAATTPPPPCLV